MSLQISPLSLTKINFSRRSMFCLYNLCQYLCTWTHTKITNSTFNKYTSCKYYVMLVFEKFVYIHTHHNTFQLYVCVLIFLLQHAKWNILARNNWNANCRSLYSNCLCSFVLLYYLKQKNYKYHSDEFRNHFLFETN